MARGYVVELLNRELNVLEDVYVEIPHEIDETNWRSTLDEAEKKAREYAQNKFGWKAEDIVCMSVNAMSVHLPENRKIIGTCKECKWWYAGIHKQFRKCINPQVNEQVLDYPIYTLSNFGCIHWERREERKEMVTDDTEG